MVTSEPDGGVTIPVQLDLTEAEQQLARFCTKIRRDLSKAVAAGLSVHALTVHMEPAPDDAS